MLSSAFREAARLVLILHIFRQKSTEMLSQHLQEAKALATPAKKEREGKKVNNGFNFKIMKMCVRVCVLD